MDFVILFDLNRYKACFVFAPDAQASPNTHTNYSNKTGNVNKVWSRRGLNKIQMFPAGIEPATSPVWRVRDNHYTKETDFSIRV